MVRSLALVLLAQLCAVFSANAGFMDGGFPFPIQPPVPDIDTMRAVQNHRSESIRDALGDFSAIPVCIQPENPHEETICVLARDLSTFFQLQVRERARLTEAWDPVIEEEIVTFFTRYSESFDDSLLRERPYAAVSQFVATDVEVGCFGAAPFRARVSFGSLLPTDVLQQASYSGAGAPSYVMGFLGDGMHCEGGDGEDTILGQTMFGLAVGTRLSAYGHYIESAATRNLSGWQTGGSRAQAYADAYAQCSESQAPATDLLRSLFSEGDSSTAGDGNVGSGQPPDFDEVDDEALKPDPQLCSSAEDPQGACGIDTENLGCIGGECPGKKVVKMVVKASILGGGGLLLGGGLGGAITFAGSIIDDAFDIIFDGCGPDVDSSCGGYDCHTYAMAAAMMGEPECAVVIDPLPLYGYAALAPEDSSRECYGYGMSDSESSEEAAQDAMQEFCEWRAWFAQGEESTCLLIATERTIERPNPCDDHAAMCTDEGTPLPDSPEIPSTGFPNPPTPLPFPWR